MLKQYHVILQRQRVVCCQKVLETHQKKFWNPVPEFFRFQNFLNLQHGFWCVLYCFKQNKRPLQHSKKIVLGVLEPKKVDIYEFWNQVLEFLKLTTKTHNEYFWIQNTKIRYLAKHIKKWGVYVEM